MLLDTFLRSEGADIDSPAAAHTAERWPGMMAPWIRMLRPYQWSKNSFCVAGVIFSGAWVDPTAVAKDLLVFAIFCVASSATYIFNDIRDREYDALHPKKNLRPIASGQVSIRAAGLVAAGLLLSALCAAFWSAPSTLLCVSLYLALNLAYSLGLKHVPLVDVNCIAAGFVLRMVAGVYVIDDVPTVWIVLCTFSLAVFLALAKRRSELVALPPGESSQRPVLKAYSVEYLDALVNSAATVTVVSYALFATLSGKNPTLLLTVPIVYYAIMRFNMLLFLEGGVEEPERILLRDGAMKFAIASWLAAYLAMGHSNVQLFR